MNEDNEFQHFELLCDKMLMSQEAFGTSFISGSQSIVNRGC